MSFPRYGIWIPVYGNCPAMNHPLEPRDASYSRAKAIATKSVHEAKKYSLGEAPLSPKFS